MFSYIFQPFYDAYIPENIGRKTLRFLKTIPTAYLALIVGAILMAIVNTFVVYVLKQPSLLTIIEEANKNVVKSPLLIILFLGPLIEELIFRLPMDLKRTSIGISVALLLYRFSSNHLLLDLSSPLEYARIPLALAGYFAIVKFLPEFILETLRQHFKYVFYGLSLTFGLAHLVNFSQLNWQLWWVFPFLVLPQFIMGLAMGYLRIRCGFIWGVLFHILVNSVATFLHSH